MTHLTRINFAVQILFVDVVVLFCSRFLYVCLFCIVCFLVCLSVCCWCLFLFYLFICLLFFVCLFFRLVGWLRCLCLCVCLCTCVWGGGVGVFKWLGVVLFCFLLRGWHCPAT